MLRGTWLFVKKVVWPLGPRQPYCEVEDYGILTGVITWVVGLATLLYYADNFFNT